MTKAELIDKVHVSLGGKEKVSRKDAERALDTVFEALRAEFLSGRDVVVSGFGTFKLRTRAARAARNPRTGGAVHVPEQRTVAFRPVPKLKDALNHPKS